MKSLIAFLAKAYGRLVCGASLLKSPLLLIIRLYWGWQSSVSGHAHLSNYAAMVENFRKWHVPFPEINVYFSAYTELILGGFLLIGLASRIITIPLIFNFFIAYLTASHDTVQQSFGAIFSDPDTFVSDASFLFLFASVIVFVFGPGVLSLDWVIVKIYAKKKPE